MKIKLEFTTSPGGWLLLVGCVLDFTKLMLISTEVQIVVEVGIELGNFVKAKLLILNV